MATPISVAVVADTSALQVGVGRAEDSLRSLDDTARASARGVETAMGGVADASDTVASKGSQAAGALSGLGSMAAESGGALGALGTAMVATGTVSQTLADAGDLLNVVTDSAIVKNIALKTQTIATTVATKAAAAGQWALNAAMSANPIGLVVLAIVALVAIFVVAYKKSETFRNIVNGAFTKVKEVISSVVDWFKEKVPPVFEVVAGAVRRYVEVWGRIFRTVKDVIKGIIDRIRDIIRGVIETIQKVIDKIQGAIDKAKELAGIDATGVSGTEGLRELNRDRYNQPGYAGGGRPAPEVGAPVTQRGGDTYNIQAHNYEDFRRQQRERERMAAMDGARRR